MQVVLQLCAIDFCGNLVGVPSFERQKRCIENKLACLLDVFVTDNRLDGCVRIVNQKLVHCFERYLALVIFVAVET